ncbi:MAG TPA: hypothetical protein VJ021_00065, partial [Thermoplasmata archaeon]|nr:hypothetical protein [Thermoplasmata archaeon]
ICHGSRPPPMRSSRPRRGRVSLAIAVLAFALVGLLLNIPASTSASSAPRSATVQPAAGVTGDVTWNGVDISTLGTISSALAIDFSQSANLYYNWSNVPAPGINDARLQMFYFGFAVATRDVSLSVALVTGHVPLNWTPLSIGYVLEGVYRLTASVIAPNGTTMWSQDFYVRGNAPLGVLAVIPIVLLLIAVYEIYGLVRSGRYAALGRKAASPPETPPPSSTPPQTPPKEAETPAEAPPEAPPDATAETPPPTGGVS